MKSSDNGATAASKSRSLNPVKHALALSGEGASNFGRRSPRPLQNGYGYATPADGRTEVDCADSRRCPALVVFGRPKVAATSTDSTLI